MFPISSTPHSPFASFSLSHRLGKGKINKFKFETIAGYGFHPQSSWRHKTYYSWLEMIIGFPLLYPNCDRVGLRIYSRPQPSLFSSSRGQPPQQLQKEFLQNLSQGDSLGILRSGAGMCNSDRGQDAANGHTGSMQWRGFPSTASSHRCFLANHCVKKTRLVEKALSVSQQTEAGLYGQPQWWTPP